MEFLPQLREVVDAAQREEECRKHAEGRVPSASRVPPAPRGARAWRRDAAVGSDPTKTTHRQGR